MILLLKIRVVIKDIRSAVTPASPKALRRRDAPAAPSPPVVGLHSGTLVAFIRMPQGEIMRRQHSYHRLFYHLVFNTKEKESFINTQADEDFLYSMMKKKAHDLSAYLLEFGSWYDHVHLLVRSPPSVLLSDVYGQLKGYSSWHWNRRRPDRPFKWADGVFAATVDTCDNEDLRKYIRYQRSRHQMNSLEPKWEPDD